MRKRSSVFDGILRKQDMRQEVESGEVVWELTLSEGPARVLLEIFSRYESYAGDQDPVVTLRSPEEQAVLRAVAIQHPEMVGEFPTLPWPRNE